MSLFICNKCGCVDNTNLNMASYDSSTHNPEYPNLCSMDMHGVGGEYSKTGVQGDYNMLCSECNTGIWHGEFDKRDATELERALGEGVKGRIFTSHSFYRQTLDLPEDKIEEMVDVINTYNSLDVGDVEDARSVYAPTNIDRSILCKSEFKRYYSTRPPYVRESPKKRRNDICNGCGNKNKKCKCEVV